MAKVSSVRLWQVKKYLDMKVTKLLQMRWALKDSADIVLLKSYEQEEKRFCFRDLTALYCLCSLYKPFYFLECVTNIMTPPHRTPFTLPSFNMCFIDHKLLLGLLVMVRCHCPGQLVSQTTQDTSEAA